MMNYYRSLWQRKDLSDDYVIDFMSQTSLEDELKSEIESHGSKYYKLPGRKKYPFQHYKTMREIVNKHTYDAVHLNCNSATGAFDLIVLRHIKNRIAHVHNSSTQYPIIHALMKPIFNQLYTDAVAVSKTCGKWIFGNHPYIVLNNAIDINKFAFDSAIREKMRSFYEIGRSEFLIGHVGKMHTDQKNQEFLIGIFPDILKAVPNAKLLLVGDGVNLEKHKKLAEELGVKDCVIFAGFHSNVNEYMQMFDLFCFPSRYEGLGMVAVEAQASGLFVIASNKVPPEANVADRVIFIGTADTDKNAWVDEIIKRAAVSEDRLKLKDQIADKIRASGYDIEFELDKLLSLYET